MKSVEKVKITEAQLKEAEEMLNKKGESVKVGRSLFNPSGTRRYTLREAIEFAKKGRLTSKIVIPEDRYAELVALYVKYSYSTKWDGVCKTLNTNDLSECILYTSCEPCPMCLSAIIWANIKEVYYGCTKNDAANVGFRDNDIYEFIKGILWLNH